MSTLVSHVLTDNNQTLFYIWDYLDVQFLISSCAPVQRKWSQHLWPVRESSKRRKRRRTSLVPTLTTPCDRYSVVTAARFNYLSTRTTLELTRFPSLKQLQNGRALRQLCRSLPNVETLILSHNVLYRRHVRFPFLLLIRWHPLVHFTEMLEVFQHVWFAVFAFCPRVSTLVCSGFNVWDLEVFYRVWHECCVRAEYTPEWNHDVRIMERTQHGHENEFWYQCSGMLRTIRASHFTYRRPSIGLQDLLFPPLALAPHTTHISLYFESFICFWDPPGDTWERIDGRSLLALRESSVTQLDWIYCGVVNKESCGRMIQHSWYPQSFHTLASLPSNGSVGERWRKHLQQPLLDERCLVRLRRITLSQRLDNALALYGWPTLRECIRAVRPAIEIVYVG